MRSTLCVLVLVLVAATATIAAAVDTDPMAAAAMEAAPPEEEPSPWQFEIAPYAWISGTAGDLAFAGRSLAVDTGPGDVLDLLFQGDAFAAGGYFGARYERFFGFLDAFGGFLRDGQREMIPTRFCTVSASARATVYPVLVDFAVGYQLGEWKLGKRLRPLSLGAYAGMRFTHFGVDIGTQAGVVGGFQGQGRAVERGFNWADPMIGLRGEIPVIDRLSFTFRGDVGGWGASSDLIWGVVGDLRYWPAWSLWSSQPWLGMGWRIAAFDHPFKGTNQADLRLSGPTAAAGFVF
jgi:hypothetical protein